jgi:hypothetical protein
VFELRVASATRVLVIFWNCKEEDDDDDDTKDAILLRPLTASLVHTLEAISTTCLVLGNGASLGRLAMLSAMCDMVKIHGDGMPSVGRLE